MSLSLVLTTQPKILFDAILIGSGPLYIRICTVFRVFSHISCSFAARFLAASNICGFTQILKRLDDRVHQIRPTKFETKSNQADREENDWGKIKDRPNQPPKMKQNLN